MEMNTECKQNHKIFSLFSLNSAELENIFMTTTSMSTERT